MNEEEMWEFLEVEGLIRWDGQYWVSTDKYEQLVKRDAILDDIQSVVDEFTRLYSEDDDKFASAIIFDIRRILRSSCQKVRE